MKYLGLGLAFVMVSCIGEAYGTTSGITPNVVPQGETVITASFGNTPVVAKIITREIDIGKPTDVRPETPVAGCTYSRFPCVLVEGVKIVVDGRSLYIPRSAYADLTDLTGASLGRQGDHFLLTMIGGDASESYTVELSFDGSFVSGRKFINNEAKAVREEAHYYPPSAMD